MNRAAFEAALGEADFSGVSDLIANAPYRSQIVDLTADINAIARTEMFDRGPLAEGDILCITAGPYPDNLGKLLRYRHAYDELIAAVVMDRVITFCDGFSRHMECGENELVLISPDHVTQVA